MESLGEPTGNALRRRSGFTLVELMVVIGVMMFLAGLTLGLLPAIYQRSDATRGGQIVQGVLAQARQRARRDRVCTGVRFSSTAGGRFLDQMAFLQQPLDIAGGPSILLSAAANSNTVNISGADLSSLQQDIVQNSGPCDFIEINGVPHLIRSVSSNSLTLASPVPYAITSSRDFRITRQPQLVQGETPSYLPANVGIDLPYCCVDGGYYSLITSLQSGNSIALSIAINLRIDIVFTPSGGLYVNGPFANNIILTVRDTRESDTTMFTSGGGNIVIVAVQTRTGFVCVHPFDAFNTSKLYYHFATDTRTSGL